MTADVKTNNYISLDKWCMGQGRRKHEKIGEHPLPGAFLNIEKGT
jgi:hypothetical protein